jgi:putative transposase
MAKPPRTATAGTFFITAVTADRRRLLQSETNVRLFLETLQHYRAQGFYKLHAFVAMPDHIHLLLTAEDLSAAMKRIRGGFSHRLAYAHDVWQRGYTDHRVLSRGDFEDHRTYIHENPVRARIVERAEDYPFSSAFRREDASLSLHP